MLTINLKKKSSSNLNLIENPSINSSMNENEDKYFLKLFL